METKTILILLGVAALGGGAYYLYKSGKLVSAPTSAATAQGPMRMMKVMPGRITLPNTASPQFSAVSGYAW